KPRHCDQLDDAATSNGLFKGPILQGSTRQPDWTPEQQAHGCAPSVPHNYRNWRLGSGASEPRAASARHPV
ncbi:hypothetical protein ABTE61_18810, partial [Acinetobacter baumannii]